MRLKLTILIALCLFGQSLLRAQSEGLTGTIVGRIIDGATGPDLAGVALVFRSMDNPEIAALAGLTDLEGRFRVENAPVGEYEARLFKVGYQTVVIEGIVVRAGETARVEYALLPINFEERKPEASEESGSAVRDDDPGMDVFELSDFTVTAEEMSKEASTFFDLRRSAVGTVDFLSSEDFSKFAISDLSGAVQKMPGINVVEGKFAVVRGLSDRFNSTLINGLPVPSPDPLRQGVPLDLFPTSIIESVTASKSFLPHMPGNSSGAAFELGTKQFPEEHEAWFKVGFRINLNAQDTFLEDPESSSADLWALGKGERGPLATTASTGSGGDVQRNFLAEESSPPITLTLGAGLGDTVSLWGRKLGYVVAFSYDATAYTEKDGTFRDWYGISSRNSAPGFPFYFEFLFQPGSLYSGELQGSGQMEYTRSVLSVLMGGLVSISYDLDRKGLNRLSLVTLYSQTSDDSVRRLSEGYLPEGGTPGGPIFNPNKAVIGVPNGDERGFYYNDQIAYEERTLFVSQLLGKHLFPGFSDLDFEWGLSYARTTSDLPRQIESNYLRFTDEIDSFEDPGFGVENGNDGVGSFLQEISRSIDQTQYGARIDGTLPFELFGRTGAELKVGGFWDSGDRAVTGTSQVLDASAEASAIRAESPAALSQAIVALDLASAPIGSFPTVADVSQEIGAGYLSFKLPLPSNIEFTAGVRAEAISMTATGSSTLGGGALGPGGASLAQLLGAGRTSIDGTELTNGEIIGFDDPTDPSGEIDETYFFPGLALTWEPTSEFTVRAGFSETVARPSFRELSPYFDRDAQTGDIVLGNPNLKLVDVRSYDLRAEYVWDDGGVAAVSVFYKDVWNPIEGALLKSGANVSFRSFFNNPAKATLKGFEIEARRDLGGFFESLEGFSVGVNFSRIQAEVQVAEFFLYSYFHFLVASDGTIRRSVGPFVGEDGPPLGIEENRLPTTRRLFDQPEWIANADISYENEDWGFSATLSYYTQSSVLSAVGVGSPTDSQNVVDQFVDSYGELNLSLSQALPWWDRRALLKLAITNLTDSTRRIVYDETVAFADTYQRLSYKRGQTYRLALDVQF